MARGKADEEEVTMAEAAKRLAMTMQGVGQWADKAPPEYVRVKKTRRTLVWPGFMVWYRQRLQATKEKPQDFEEAKTRKMAAEAEMAELDLAKARGESVAVATVRTTMRGIIETVRAQLMAVPGRYAARTVGLATLPESQRTWDAAIRDVLGELRDGDSAR